jgi:ubiquinone/menaquinone biosynthesis C-methylase UbiE
MDNNFLQQLAAQLRQPNGDMGVEVAQRMNEGNAFMNRFAMAQLNLKGDETLLEIGMGNGLFAKEMLQQHPRLSYLGLDYSELMVLKAKEILLPFEEDGRAAIHLGQAAQMPFDDESCDKIIGVNVVYFWDNPTIELTELRRVLRPGGRIVLGMRSLNTMKKLPVTRFNFNLYSEAELTTFAQEANLTLVEIKTIEEELPDFNGKPMLTETWAVILER